MKTVIEMAREAGFTDGELAFMQDNFLLFAELVRADERERMQQGIDTLHNMYEQACRQRDELMDQQRAQVAVMRGRIQ